jgi:hypothetical protein
MKAGTLRDRIRIEKPVQAPDSISGASRTWQLVGETLTAWSGPWGVSFSANLTPDAETGILRDFSEQQFVLPPTSGMVGAHVVHLLFNCWLSYAATGPASSIQPCEWTKIDRPRARSVLKPPEA